MIFVLESKTNNKRSSETLPLLLLILPFVYIGMCNAESQKMVTKGQLLKKTRVLCWSVFFLVYAVWYMDNWDLLEVSHSDGGDTAEDGCVGQLVLELIHRHRHVARLLRARVHVPENMLHWHVDMFLKTRDIDTWTCSWKHVTLTRGQYWTCSWKNVTLTRGHVPENTWHWHVDMFLKTCGIDTWTCSWKHVTLTRGHVPENMWHWHVASKIYSFTRTRQNCIFGSLNSNVNSKWKPSVKLVCSGIRGHCGVWERKKKDLNAPEPLKNMYILSRDSHFIKEINVAFLVILSFI